MHKTLKMNRRGFVGACGAGAATVLAGGCATGSTSGSPMGKVIVIGGGFGGATAAKYLRLWSDNRIDVTLIEPNRSFVSCPISNLVIGGSQQIGDITVPYANLASRHGVKLIHDTVTAIDPAKKTVRLASGDTLPYDRLVLSPGIDFMWDTVKDLQAANQAGRILQAWKAGPETVALRRQLEAMPDGGVYALAIPEAPYRCPPGPYERASVIAGYFRQAKPKSKVLILDANADVTSKGPLFKRVWAEQYKGILEYRPQHKAIGVDARANVVKFEVHDDIKADVLNVLPAMRAGTIAQQTGLANINARWCDVNYMSYESKVHAGIHVIGDAIQLAPLMPKSGHMANQQAKVAASAIVEILAGRAPHSQPVVMNTCYSFVDAKTAIHVASIHQYNAQQQTMLTVPGSGGVSGSASELEGTYAMAWAANIWADMLA
jgi:sulfide dehydrogenase [flavocytochrome c] flavoprotein chain